MSSHPARASLHQLLSRGPLPLGAEQGHTELESGHAPTVSYGESRRTAASRWIAPSIRVARGSLSQLGCSRYSVGRREVRPQHFPSRADHALQHVLEGGPGLESSLGQIMMMDTLGGLDRRSVETASGTRLDIRSRLSGHLHGDHPKGVGEGEPMDRLDKDEPTGGDYLRTGQSLRESGVVEVITGS